MPQAAAHTASARYNTGAAAAAKTAGSSRLSLAAATAAAKTASACSTGHAAAPAAAKSAITRSSGNTAAPAAAKPTISCSIGNTAAPAAKNTPTTTLACRRGLAIETAAAARYFTRTSAAAKRTAVTGGASRDGRTIAATAGYPQQSVLTGLAGRCSRTAALGLATTTTGQQAATPPVPKPAASPSSCTTTPPVTLKAATAAAQGATITTQSAAAAARPGTSSATNSLVLIKDHIIQNNVGAGIHKYRATRAQAAAATIPAITTLGRTPDNGQVINLHQHPRSHSICPGADHEHPVPARAFQHMPGTLDGNRVQHRRQRAAQADIIQDFNKMRPAGGVDLLDGERQVRFAEYTERRRH
ncbi:MAG: hypothetical protein Q7T36_13215 [Fluviicoccus sp.]|uniref:hypothetical protein n=1 Tax=Fluviicoccus sp. TaxID=2003552 RepID=UPI0027227B49|nr:hypothetical protein [Fluviicoccus sp.]MDO8331418.1 hypothetical protein [Fluviicoccus sp.]